LNAAAHLNSENKKNIRARQKGGRAVELRRVFSSSRVDVRLPPITDFFGGDSFEHCRAQAQLSEIWKVLLLIQKRGQSLNSLRL
jgi:hypothetical protein